MKAEMKAAVGWSEPRASHIEGWKLVFEEVLGWVDLQHPYQNRDITAEDMRDFLGYARVRAADEWYDPVDYNVRKNEITVYDEDVQKIIRWLEIACAYKAHMVFSY